MTQLNAPTTPTTKGFSAPVLGLIEHAQRNGQFIWFI